MAEDERKNDKLILIQTLTIVERELFIIVHKRTYLFRRDLRNLFPGPWDQVARRFEHARESLEKDAVDWHYIEGVGLTGEMLRFKKSMLDRSVSAIQEEKQAGPLGQSVRKGVVGRFLKIANSILGSLAKALPVLEVVKEYKEHVEAAISVQNRWR